MPDIATEAAIVLRRPELFRQQAFIGGSWTGEGGRLTVFNPATGQRIGAVPDVGWEGASRAVSTACAAFSHWRTKTAADRGGVLRRWAGLMTANREDLATLMVCEQGKPWQEALGEVDYAASFLVWFADEALRVYGDVIPGHAAGKRLTVIKQPVGIVGAVTPWNFPLAMVTRKAAPAIAAGCTMVLKPSELTPFCALALAFLAEEAGLPAGVFNVVTGLPVPIGEVLTGDARVRKFTFTGSTIVGSALAARCMGTVKRVSLELGGNAPFIVFDDGEIDAAVEGVMASKFRNSGQTCVCANRIYVQSGCYEQFVAALADRVAALKPGDGLEEGTTQGPLINARAVEKVELHLADAMERGARLIIGGTRPEGAGSFFAPTLIADVSPDSLLCREETFGPLAGVIRFETEVEVIAMANETGGLAAYFYTADHRRVARVSETLEFGMVGVNTGMISTATAPFGGVKQAGFGREGSKYGIDEYLDLKLICDDIGAGG